MRKVARFQAIIAVGDVAQVIVAPKDAMVGMDGTFCEDNSFKNVPTEKGIYLCWIDFYFEQGYFEGYKADGESDWEYKVVKAEPLTQLPDVSKSWEVLKEFGNQKVYCPDSCDSLYGGKCIMRVDGNEFKGFLFYDEVGLGKKYIRRTDCPLIKRDDDE